MTDGNFGWLTESGKVLRFQAKRGVLPIDDAALSGQRTIEEVGGVKLHAGLGRVHFHHAPALRLIDARRQRQALPAAVQHDSYGRSRPGRS